MLSNKSCAYQIFLFHSPKTLCFIASKPGCPWRVNLSLEVQLRCSYWAAVTSVLSREPWNPFSWKSHLKSSSQTINPLPNSQFTPPRRDFSEKASCPCPDQGKNPLAVMTEQRERAWSKPGQVQPCSYWGWREFHLPHPLAHQASQRGFGRGPRLQTRLSSQDLWMWGETDYLPSWKQRLASKGIPRQLERDIGHG